MDDHFFDRIMSYAECELIPRFQDEFSRFGSLAACPSYSEMQDFCKILNIADKWVDTTCHKHWMPSEFVKEE